MVVTVLIGWSANRAIKIARPGPSSIVIPWTRLIDSKGKLKALVDEKAHDFDAQDDHRHRITSLFPTSHALCHENIRFSQTVRIWNHTDDHETKFLVELVGMPA
jgi:hypothetical protein